MLNKLLKHELKTTAKLLVPIYLILLVFTMMNRIVLNLHIFKGYLSIIPALITAAYVISIIAVIMVSSIYMIARFYKNLLTDEGYLMFTLPVKSCQLINAKLLISIFWTIAGIIAVIASVLVVSSTPGELSRFLAELKSVRNELQTQFGSKTTLLIAEFMISMILGLINTILMIYVSIAIGQLFNSHKIIGSFVAYVCISVILQFAITILAYIAGQIYDQNINDLMVVPNLILPCIIFFISVLSLVYYFVTAYIFKKKLNLE